MSFFSDSVMQQFIIREKTLANTTTKTPSDPIRVPLLERGNDDAFGGNDKTPNLQSKFCPFWKGAMTDKTPPVPIRLPLFKGAIGS
jgi:hypothetical protein